MSLSMGMGMTLARSAGGVVLPAIEVVNANSNAGASTTLAGLQDGDDVFVVARRASATPSGPPSGNPQSWTTLATAVSGSISVRLFHVSITSAMLTDGAYATGNTNAAATRVWAVALRNVTGLTTAVQSATTTSSRPFSSLSGLTARGVVVGYCYLSAATTPPIPSGASMPTNGDQAGSGRLWTAGPTATWAPADGTSGSSTDWFELAVGAI